MKSLHTELVIDASVDKVWQVLTEFSAYPVWNPFIKEFRADPALGSRFKVVLQLPDSKPMTFKPKCLALDQKKEFRWLGHLIIPGLFDGEHFFKLKELEGGKTKFVQGENFQGILVPMFWKKIKGKTILGFERMNTALKNRAESL